MSVESVPGVVLEGAAIVEHELKSDDPRLLSYAESLATTILLRDLKSFSRAIAKPKGVLISKRTPFEDELVRKLVERVDDCVKVLLREQYQYRFTTSLENQYFLLRNGDVVALQDKINELSLLPAGAALEGKEVESSSDDEFDDSPLTRSRRRASLLSDEEFDGRPLTRSRSSRRPSLSFADKEPFSVRRRHLPFGGTPPESLSDDEESPFPRSPLRGRVSSRRGDTLPLVRKRLPRGRKRPMEMPSREPYGSDGSLVEESVTVSLRRSGSLTVVTGEEEAKDDALSGASFELVASSDDEAEVSPAEKDGVIARFDKWREETNTQFEEFSGRLELLLRQRECFVAEIIFVRDQISREERSDSDIESFNEHVSVAEASLAAFKERFEKVGEEWKPEEGSLSSLKRQLRTITSEVRELMTDVTNSFDLFVREHHRLMNVLEEAQKQLFLKKEEKDETQGLKALDVQWLTTWKAGLATLPEGGLLDAVIIMQQRCEHMLGWRAKRIQNEKEEIVQERNALQGGRDEDVSLKEDGFVVDFYRNFSILQTFLGDIRTLLESPEGASEDGAAATFDLVEYHYMMVVNSLSSLGRSLQADRQLRILEKERFEQQMAMEELRDRIGQEAEMSAELQEECQRLKALVSRLREESVSSTIGRPRRGVVEGQGPASLRVFINNFNAGALDMNEAFEKAKIILQRYEQQSWIRLESGLKVPNVMFVVEAREGFCLLAECKNPLISRRAYHNLINLLETDIFVAFPDRDEAPDRVVGSSYEEDFAKGLPALLTMLVEQLRTSQEGELVRSGEFQNNSITGQQLAARACAACIECMITHHAAGKAGAITKSIRTRTLELVKALRDHSVTDDPETKAFIDHAYNGALRLEIDEDPVTKWFGRLVNVGKLVVSIVGVVRQPSLDGMRLVADGFLELKDAISDIRAGLDPTYERAVLVRGMIRAALMHEQMFRRVEHVIQGYKLGELQHSLFYNIIIALEFALRSRDPKVQSSAMKLMLQYLTVADADVQARIVLAFSNMLRDERLAYTAYCVLRLLDICDAVQTPSVHDKLITCFSVDKVPSFVSVHEDVISLLLEKFLGINRTSRGIDLGGESLCTQLVYARNSRLVSAAYQEIKQRFPGQERDVYGNTILIVAARERRPDLITALQGAVDFNASDNEERTALHIAVDQLASLRTSGADYALPEVQLMDAESVAVITALLNGAADPNIADKVCETPFLCACRHGLVDIVTLMFNPDLDFTIDLTFFNCLSKTGLALLIDIDCLPGVQLVMDHGGGVARGSTPVIEAARSGAINCLTYLLRRQSEYTSIEVREVLRMMCDDAGALSCSDEFARFHLQLLADKPAYAEAVAAHRGLYQPRLVEDTNTIEVVRAEQQNFFNMSGNATTEAAIATFVTGLAARGELDTVDDFGITPYQGALLAGNTALAKALKDGGADINAKGAQGNTALHLFAYLRNAEMLKYLLDAGVNATVTNDYGDTPAHILSGSFDHRTPEAFLRDRLPVHPMDYPEGDMTWKLLIDALGEKPHECLDVYGRSLLDHAACRGVINPVIAYLSKTEMFWMENYNGFYPVQEAARENRLPVIELMLKSRGDIAKLCEEFHERTSGTVSLEHLLASLNLSRIFSVVFKMGQDEGSEGYGDRVMRRVTSTRFVETKMSSARRVSSARMPGLSPSIRRVSDIKATPQFLLTDALATKDTPALLVAARLGNVGVVKDMYRARRPLDVRGLYDNTAMHVAAAKDHNDFVRALLKYGANPKDCNQAGRTPLFIFAARGNIAGVKLLLAHDPSLAFDRDGMGNTPVHIACKYGRLDALRELLFSEVFNDVDTKEEQRRKRILESLTETNDKRRTPLHLACSGNDHIRADQIVEFLLEEFVRQNPSADGVINYMAMTDASGNTSLALASAEGYHLCVTRLCAAGANIAARDDDFGRTPLHKAVSSGSMETTQVLMDCDAVTTRKERLADLRDHAGNVPLHALSTNNCNIDLLRFMLARRANPLIRNDSGKTYLHVACLSGSLPPLECSWAYLAADSSKRTELFSARDKGARTLLHDACYGEYEVPGNNYDASVVGFLVDHVPDILDKREKDTRLTALTVAATEGKLVLTAYLIGKGAKTSKYDCDKNSYLHLLFKHVSGRPGLLMFLQTPCVARKLHRMVGLRNDEGKTILHILAEFGCHSDELYGVVDMVLGSLPGSAEENINFVNLEDKSGMTAEQIAREKGHSRLAQFIITYGVSPDLITKYGLMGHHYLAWREYDRTHNIGLLRRMFTRAGDGDG